MSATLLSPNGESRMITVRRTEATDVPNIFPLVDSMTEKLFGKLNIFSSIEKAVFSICMIDEEETLYGHSSFFDFPQIKDIDQATWEDWMQELPGTNCTPLNSLFLGLFVANPDYIRSCIREMLHTLFIALPDIHYCIWVFTSEQTLEAVYEDVFVFQGALPHVGADGTEDHIYHIYIAHRHMFEPLLYIRNARVEDSDEVTPLFNSLNGTLQSVYGDYYISELIESKGESMQCIVAEVNDYAVGLMGLNTDIDLNFLNKSYSLDIFERLHHRTSLIHPKTEGASSICKSPTLRPSGPTPTSYDQSDEHQMSAEVAQFARRGQKSLSILSVSFDGNTGEHVETKVNAFYIALFAIHDKYQTRAEDFLVKAFEIYPQHDMCLISLPHLVPEFPLLRLFVRVSPRRGCFPPQELYVFHRSALVKNIKVRKACSTDLESVWMLTKGLQQQDSLLEDLNRFNDYRRDEDGTAIYAYVALLADQLVGVAIMRGEEDIEYLRSHYNIEDYIYYNHHHRSEHGHLCHFVMNPAFKYLSKFFMKEILRQSYKTCLYHPLYPPYVPPEVSGYHSMLTCLSELIPVTHRRQIIYPDQLGINAPSDKILNKKPPFALTHMNQKLALESKLTVNARIVVVGASTLGLTFLDTLVFSPHLSFNNLTLVSPHGLPGDTMPHPNIQNIMAHNFQYTLEDLALKSLSTWVNVISSKMTKIVREKKLLHTGDGHVVPYDFLVLCCGLQYQCVVWDVDKPLAPINDCFLQINDLTDAWNAVSYIAETLRGSDTNMNFEEECHFHLEPTFEKAGNIIVYGNSMDAYCLIETLLSMSYPAQNIYLVIPSTTTDISFLDGSIEGVINGILDKRDLVIHYNCDFVKFHLMDENNTKFAYFLDKKKNIKIEFSAFFSFHAKTIDYNAFKAINDAFLIVDHKIVIDNDFHTTDPAIWAAGTFTQYRRALYSDSWVHGKFNSTEIGRALAEKVLNIFNPALRQPAAQSDEEEEGEVEGEHQQQQQQKQEEVEEEAEEEEEMPKLVTKYVQPKMYYAILPGGYHYLHVYKPDIDFDRFLQIRDSISGSILATGSPLEPCGFFEVYISRYNLVQSIICFRKEEFPASNFVQLYGVHETLLNSLMQRYKEGLITDFFSYFMQPFCLPIYHDRFRDIQKEIHQVVLDEKRDLNLYAELKDLLQYSDGLAEMIPNLDLNELAKRYKKVTQPRQLVEHHVLSYLYYNDYHFPMFAKPGCI
ncbi:cilia- and flagella-associated protein 61-like isoform X1 [Argonauta hians]